MRRLLPLSLPALWILLATLGATPLDVRAAAPEAVNHQGLLVDTLGEPLDGTVDLAVRIWEHPTSTVLGDLAYFEDHLATPVVDGVYSIEIGTGSAVSGPFSATLFASPDRWLELVVNGEVMAPRQKLLSVIYALQAEICADAATLGGLTSASIIASAQSSIPFTNLTGLIADAQVPASFTRDAEVFGLVLAGDGPASGLNADLLDGLSSAAFSQLGPTIESVEITDLTVATVDLANASVTAAKLVDGAGSGVDADLVDGLSSASFLRSDLSTNFTGFLFTITGSSIMTVNGTLRVGQDSAEDSDEIFFDQSGESLTWNNASTRFEVSDDLRADSFAFNTAISRNLRLSGNSFVPYDGGAGDGTWGHSGQGYGYVFGDTGTPTFILSASVNLPASATITAFSCSRYLGTGPGEIIGSAFLQSRSAAGTANTTHASVDLGTATIGTAVQVVTNATIASPTVSDSADYWIIAQWDSTASGLQARFYGCSIEYNLVTLEPS